MSRLLDRVAGAPITWGVCEVPGWGNQLEADRVLAEMAGAGLRATERGPDGFLPPEPHLARERLESHGLALVGGFVPAVLHRKEGLADELDSVARSADVLAACGAEVLVLAAATAADGYSDSRGIGEDEWSRLVDGVERAMTLGAERGLSVVIHPHYGTVVQGPGDVERLLERSPVRLCLDTGHLIVGGADPLRIARQATQRIGHVHLKDVDGEKAAQARDRRIGYHEAVRRGMYRPLGQGDARIAEIVTVLERSGYSGWYVIEQDTVLDGRAEERPDPLGNVLASMAFLRRIASELGVKDSGHPEKGGRSHEASPKSREEVGK